MSAAIERALTRIATAREASEREWVRWSREGRDRLAVQYHAEVLGLQAAERILVEEQAREVAS